MGWRDEGDLALQQGGEMRAPIGGLEVVVSARGEEIGVEEENGIIEQRLARDRSLVEGLQEGVTDLRRKGIHLKGIRRVFVRRMTRCGPLQVLMHDSVDDLMNDEASIKIMQWKIGIRRVLDQRRDIRFLRDKNSFLLGVEQPKDRAIEGMSDLAHDVHMKGPAQRNLAATEQSQRLIGCGTRQAAFVFRYRGDNNVCVNASMLFRNLLCAGGRRNQEGRHEGSKG